MDRYARGKTTLSDYGSLFSEILFCRLEIENVLTRSKRIYSFKSECEQKLGKGASGKDKEERNLYF
jgi:hypothetical protein